MEATQSYRYAPPSLGSTGAVSIATSGGSALLAPSRHPYFFAGFLTRPQVAALALKAVAEVAATNYTIPVPPRWMRDPVVTSSGDRLRFESFSACGGVLARFDLLADGFDGDVVDRGTTNVDVNEPLRRFLAGIRAGDTLRLSVGSDELVVSAPQETHVERRVPLPGRWLRGFAEAQAVAAQFGPGIDLTTPAAMSLLAALRGTATGWVVPTARGARLATRPTSGAVFLSGADRLGSMAALVRHATRLRTYGPRADAGSGASDVGTFSGWELALPGGRFTVLLSPDRWQGFSGAAATLGTTGPNQNDGQGTDTAVDVDADADRTVGLVGQDSTIDAVAVAETSGVSVSRVQDALTHLALAGRVGYDLAEASYFHRELPYDPAAVAALSPARVRQAEALQASGAVRLVPGALEVTSGDRIYHVRRDGEAWSCTCRWWTTHHGTRGPCKHVMAAARQAAGSDSPPAAGSGVTP